MLIPILKSCSKILLAAIGAGIIIQIFFNVKFAQLCKYVDINQSPPQPIAFEMFPFVVYNMYSGKVDDWSKYNYLRIEADGSAVKVTDFPVIVEDQLINPTQKFLTIKPNGFEEQNLRAFLHDILKPDDRAERIYHKVSNASLQPQPDKWGAWMQRYLSAQLKRPVKTIRIFSCQYQYNSQGQPELLDQQEVYQYP